MANLLELAEKHHKAVGATAGAIVGGISDPDAPLRGAAIGAAAGTGAGVMANKAGRAAFVGALNRRVQQGKSILRKNFEKKADLLSSAMNLAAKNKRVTGAIVGGAVGAVAGGTTNDGHRVGGALLGAAAGAGVGYVGGASLGKAKAAINPKAGQTVLNPELTQRIINSDWTKSMQPAGAPVPKQLAQNATVSKQQMVDSAALSRSTSRRLSIQHDARLSNMQAGFRPTAKRATEAEDSFIVLPNKQKSSGPIALGPSTVPDAAKQKQLALADSEKQKQISLAWQQHGELDTKSLAARLQNPNLEANTFGNMARVKPLKKKANMKELVQKYTAKAIRLQVEHPTVAGAVSGGISGGAIGGVVGATQDDTLKGTAVGAAAGVALGATGGFETKRIIDKLRKFKTANTPKPVGTTTTMADAK
jgi:hypothetical protein